MNAPTDVKEKHIANAFIADRMVSNIWVSGLSLPPGVESTAKNANDKIRVARAKKALNFWVISFFPSLNKVLCFSKNTSSLGVFFSEFSFVLCSGCTNFSLSYKTSNIMSVITRMSKGHSSQSNQTCEEK